MPAHWSLIPIAGTKQCSIAQILHWRREGERITAPSFQGFHSPDGKQVLLLLDPIFPPQTDSKTPSVRRTEAVYIAAILMPAIVSKSLSCGVVPKQGTISSQMDPAQSGTIITTEVYLNIAFIGAVNYTTIRKDIG